MCNKLPEELREAIDLVASTVGQRTYLARREKGDSRESADSKAVLDLATLRPKLRVETRKAENGMASIEITVLSMNEEVLGVGTIAKYKGMTSRGGENTLKICSGSHPALYYYEDGRDIELYLWGGMVSANTETVRGNMLSSPMSCLIALLREFVRDAGGTIIGDISIRDGDLFSNLVPILGEGEQC